MKMVILIKYIRIVELESKIPGLRIFFKLKIIVVTIRAVHVLVLFSFQAHGRTALSHPL